MTLQAVGGIKVWNGTQWVGAEAAGPEDGFTLITTIQEFEAIFEDAASRAGLYRLAADLDYNNAGPDSNLGTLTGTLDGAGHVIDGIRINQSGTQGLLINGGLITRLGLTNVNINTGDSSTYKGPYANSDNGVWVDCYTEGLVASSGDRAGGFIGFANGETILVRCYTAIEMTGGGTRTGKFTGGSNSNGRGVQCYYDNSLGGTTDAHGFGNIAGSFTGQTTANMQTEGTFSGWNFDTVWEMPENDYPRLRKHSGS